MPKQFDIFIWHNNRSQNTLRPFVEKLVRYGFQAHIAMFDNATPESMKDVHARMVIIAVGDDGAGAWELPQVAADLEVYSGRGVQIAIMLLSGAPAELALPPFLKYSEIIDLRREDDHISWDRFILNTLEVLKVLETSRAILTGPMKLPTMQSRNQVLDAMGTGAVKSQLHALSEIVARDASEEAARAAKTYPFDVLTMLVPLFVDLRWRRGYRTALERLLKLPEPEKYLRHFTCEETKPPCKVDQGIVSAQMDSQDVVLILLANYPAARVSQVTEQEAESIMDAVNNYGRLPRSKTGELSVIERIRDIPVRGQPAWKDDIALALYRNRDTLIPLLARFRIPRVEWLLSDDEELTNMRHELVESVTQELRKKELPLAQNVTSFNADAAFRAEEIDLSQVLFNIRHLKRQ